jgi:hypothetical protein
MRHNCTAPSLSAITALSSPINCSHHGRSACAIASFAFLSAPHGLRRAPSSSSTVTRMTSAVRRRRLDRPQCRRSDGPRRTRWCTCAPMRASMVAAAVEGAQAADLPTGRIDPPPPPRFDPLLSIDPRQLEKINAGAPGSSRETAQATVVHPAQRRRVDLSRFAPYPLPSSDVRVESMAPPPSPTVMP